MPVNISTLLVIGSYQRAASSTFSSDIAHAVSRAGSTAFLAGAVAQ
jgi:hypothetical protein